jgi:Trk K+ transport system NAD-binding subunit
MQPQNRPTARARRHSIWRLLRANLYDLGLLLTESWVVLAAFLAVTLVAMLYFRLDYDACRYDGDPLTGGCRLSLAESLYEAIKLQTLQSGQPFPRDSLIGQALFFTVPLLGLALIFQGVLNFGRLLLDKGSRREAWQVALASTYHDHVVICGLGRVGYRTAVQLLEAGHAPVVVERDWSSEFVEAAVNDRVPVVVGDAREHLTLRRAGVDRARAVIAVVNDDLMNVEIALAVRSLRPDVRVILRVFSEDLDRNLERTLGRDAAFSASALAAPTYAAAAVSRDVDVVLPLDGRVLGVTSMTVARGSQLAGLARVVERRGVRLLYHEPAAGRRAPPGPMTNLGAGDRLALLGPLGALEELRRANSPGGGEPTAGAPPQHPNEQLDRVIICGLGKVGYRVVHQLHALTPRPHIVVVRMADGRADFARRVDRLDGVDILIGDARDPDLLREAGIDRAFSVAALTSDDLLNLQISLAARRVRPDLHVVVRVFSDALADRLGDMFGIRTAYSTAALAGPTLAAAALAGGVERAIGVGGEITAVERLRVEAGSALAGVSVEELRARYAATALELRRGGGVVSLPAPEERLEVGDELALLVPIERLVGLRGAGRHATMQPGTRRRTGTPS